MGNLEKRNKIEMIILVLSINEEAKMKRILCFLNKTSWLFQVRIPIHYSIKNVR